MDYPNLKDAVYTSSDGLTLEEWAASPKGQAFMDRAELHQETRRQYRARVASGSTR